MDYDFRCTVNCIPRCGLAHIDPAKVWDAGEYDLSDSRRSGLVHSHVRERNNEVVRAR